MTDLFELKQRRPKRFNHGRSKQFWKGDWRLCQWQPNSCDSLNWYSWSSSKIQDTKRTEVYLAVLACRKSWEKGESYSRTQWEGSPLHDGSHNKGSDKGCLILCRLDCKSLGGKAMLPTPSCLSIRVRISLRRKEMIKQTMVSQSLKWTQYHALNIV